jgi:drug/metabolite transporter (DMT)-like permease
VDVSRTRILVGLVIGISCVSTAAIFIKLCDAPSLMIATYRLALASLILTPYAFHERRYRRINRENWPLLAASGVFLCLHFVTWIASLKYTSVASSVVLVTTMPVFCALISHFFLGDRITGPLAWGIALAMAGTVTICFDDLSISRTSLYGDMLALLGAIFGAGYLLVGKRIRKESDLFSYIFPVYGVSALLLVLFSLAFHVPFTGYNQTTYLLFLMLAIVPQLLGHSSFNWALRYLSASLVGLVTLGEPVLSTLLAWLILGESLTFGKVLGGLITFGGIYLAVRYAMWTELGLSSKMQDRGEETNR